MSNRILTASLMNIKKPETRVVFLNESFCKEFELPERTKVRVVLLPHDASTSPSAQLMDALKPSFEEKTPLVLDIDPSLYLYQSRKLARLSQKAAQREHPSMKLEVYAPFTWEEPLIRADVIENIFKAYTQQKIGEQMSFAEISEKCMDPDVDEKYLGSSMKIVHDFTKESLFTKATSSDSTSLTPVTILPFLMMANAGFPVFLGGMPEILARIQSVKNMSVEDMAEALKTTFEMLAEFRLENSEYPEKIVLGSSAFYQIFYVVRSFYLCCFVEEVLKNTKSDLTVVTHPGVGASFDFLLGEDKEEVSFKSFCKVEDVKNKEEAFEMIDKMAMVDSMMNTRLWSEHWVRNPFFYLYKDQPKMTPEDIKEFEKHFFACSQKWNTLKAQIIEEVTKFKPRTFKYQKF